MFERRRLLRRKSSAARRKTLTRAARDRYAPYFAYAAAQPSDEVTTVRGLSNPLIKTAPVTLPFDLGQAVADNCLSLSGMGYYLGLGGCCPTCAAAEPRLGRSDRAALVLAYVQQLNSIYEYRVFLASVAARDPSERALEEVLAHPELFFAYYVLRDGGLRDVRVLFFEDPDAQGALMMYVVFPEKSVHVHHRVLDRLLGACAGHRIVAHVWQTMFVLVVRKKGDGRPADDVPAVSASDIYCKMRDISFDGELLLEYKRLYAAFEDFRPPRP
ncbi:nuclear egress lamina protein [Suid alphaherpesvirus 1]|uniref:Nuclear egress lamina protein n=3 Tax=Suid herpesvirus 1 TaxID=10345 RepID=G3G955_SUHV|nr:UL31 protein [Suid alphaherpesvirus 1]YP_068334.1 nuclear egress lamina protein [Suid alphaherpesvirus 1]CAC67412.1 UL31 protein [Suid herpesvirus 1 strain Kaplan]AEM63983.1 UL31 protein [Suid alphaherpesvirus 1]AEM64052.1 UL31 protein [Suid alphaherpesvirus 1]AEM64121.1 UL31 protein [Suid alphaherpesvirus 1]AFI70796.1 UL31 [Suid alphaherpesvirus 1]